jgi:diguanylate cyclase (GGDEF)-like protein
MDPARNPNVSRFAGRLYQLFQRTVRAEDRAEDPETRHAVEDVLRYAADAERKVAELSRQIKHLEQLSEQDQLTGIANRRGLEKYLDTTLASAQRYYESGVLIFVDLDDFKRINDRFNHDAGDQVLKGVAQVLDHCTRRSDFVARLGGDEFVVVLPRTDPAIAGVLADKLHDTLEDTVFSCGGVGLSVRASFGAVPYSPYSTAENLLCRADRAMYAQKRGRSTLRKLFGAAR